MAALALVSTTLIAGSPASAMSFEDPTSAVVGCETTEFSHGRWILDRNNDGADNERYIIHVSDGYGNTLYFKDITHRLGTGGPATTDILEYSTEPISNPIHFSMTSPAGNSLPEQIAFEATGLCAGLPYLDPPVVSPADFTTPGGVPLSGTLAPFAWDFNGDPLSFSLQTAPTADLVMNTDGTFLYTPGSFLGVDSFVVEVSDGTGNNVPMDVTVTVGDTSDIVIQASPNPAVEAGLVDLTATVSSPNSSADLSGTVEFFYDTASLGTAPVDPATGIAVLPGITFAAGSHQLTAEYSGNTGTAASASEAEVLTVTALDPEPVVPPAPELAATGSGGETVGLMFLGGASLIAGYVLLLRRRTALQ